MNWLFDFKFYFFLSQKIFLFYYYLFLGENSKEEFNEVLSIIQGLDYGEVLSLSQGEYLEISTHLDENFLEGLQLNDPVVVCIAERFIPHYSQSLFRGSIVQGTFDCSPLNRDNAGGPLNDKLEEWTLLDVFIASNSSNNVFSQSISVLKAKDAPENLEPNQLVPVVLSLQTADLNETNYLFTFYVGASSTNYDVAFSTGCITWQYEDSTQGWNSLLRIGRPSMHCSTQYNFKFSLPLQQMSSILLDIPFFFDMWVKPTSEMMNRNSILIGDLSDHLGKYLRGWALALHKGKISLHLSSQESRLSCNAMVYAVSEQVLEPDQWYHVALLLNPQINIARVYLNRRLVIELEHVYDKFDAPTISRVVIGAKFPNMDELDCFNSNSESVSQDHRSSYDTFQYKSLGDYRIDLYYHEYGGETLSSKQNPDLPPG